MLPKLILVMWVMAGRNDAQIQYVVRMPTEAACKAEAAKHQPQGWSSYPVQHATCVFDATEARNANR